MVKVSNPSVFFNNLRLHYDFFLFVSLVFLGVNVNYKLNITKLL